VNTLSYIFPALVGPLLDLVFDLVTLIILCLREFSEILGISVLAGVDESLFLHINHHSSMLLEMHREVVLQDEEFFFQGILSLHSVLVFDGFLPHSHELPLLEFLKEVKLLNVVI
jgi:hypothetical protein